MIVYVQDWDKKIIGFIEFWITNGKQEFGGDYIYIRELWIHPDERGTKLLNRLIRKVYDHEFTQDCKYVYWNRGEHQNRNGDYIDARVSKTFRKYIAARQGE